MFLTVIFFLNHLFTPQMLFLGLLFSGVAAQGFGCVKEEYIQYDGQDVLEEVTLESPQACADRCASSEEGLFWTFGLNSKACQVKKSLQGRRGIMYTVSGTRNCGLFNMSGRNDGYFDESGRLDHIKVVASKEDNKSPPNQCADNNTATVCTVPASPAPWLALDLGSKQQVNRVEIRNTKFGGRVRDFEVRVTDSLPPSGETMFKEGDLLGSYVGDSVVWEKITIESVPSEPQPEGRYVLLQQNFNRALQVMEVAVFRPESTSSASAATLMLTLTPVALPLTLFCLFF